MVRKFGFPAAILAALFIMWLASACNGTTTSASGPATSVHAGLKTDTMPDCTAGEARPATSTRKPGWGRDPFQHPEEDNVSTNDRAANGARLVAIVTGQKGRMAIFDHSILQKGDLVGNERIVDIAENRVTVIHEGCKRIIAMQETR